MQEKDLEKSNLNIIDCLISLNLASSRGDAKKLLAGGGVKVNDEIITDTNYTCPAQNFVLRKGKKTILRVLVK